MDTPISFGGDRHELSLVVITSSMLAVAQALTSLMHGCIE